MNRPLLVFVSAVSALAACDGFKEAMTAHVDVVASAGSQKLSVDRLSELIGNSQVPISADVAKSVSELWVNYQLLAHAAATNDSLTDTKLVDEALWPLLAQARANKWHEIAMKNRTVPDSAGARAAYDQSELLAASHILLMAPEQGLSQGARDSIGRKAATLRQQVTQTNFAEMARKNSMDQQSAQRGGALGVFPRGAMVKEFEQAVLALKPGEISPVVRSSFGYHIIRRATYAEVKDEFAQALVSNSARSADSLYIAKLVESGNIKVRDGAAATVREVIKDPSAHEKNNAVIATSRAGNFTAGRLAQWVKAMPQMAQVQSMLPQAADSDVVSFARNFVTNELVLHQADSAKVALDPKEMAEFRSQFGSLVTGSWAALGISPAALSDSAKSASERERVAAAQIESYMDRLLANQASYVNIPGPLQAVLRGTYDWKVNAAGLDRAVQRAGSIRKQADSVRAAQRPPSAVPMQPQMQTPPTQRPPAQPPSSQPAPKTP
ncbi:MAG: peptidylprolyl isomerase [Gemmatimonadaceae bacterium]